ncbi:hypothetical protein PAMA_016320 [Pampus argenteus]
MASCAPSVRGATKQWGFSKSKEIFEMQACVIWVSLPTKMSNTTLGNCSLVPFYDDLINSDVTVIPNLVSMILRLPVSIYILKLIVSRHLIISEFYTFNEEIFEIFICLFDSLRVLAYVFSDTSVMKSKQFFLGFVVTGRPWALTLICVDRYLAVVKPVTFLRFKPLRYKLTLSGIIWLGTLVSCSGNMLVSFGFHYVSVAQIILNCVVNLYCAIATLLALKQPVPGEGVKQMCNMKLKAFRIILIMTVSFIIVYVPLVVVVLSKQFIDQQLFSVLKHICYTFTVLSGFVQAMLFLQRSGCVICKCADSCSRSPSFDSAVGVINGSVNCDSSQTSLNWINSDKVCSSSLLGCQQGKALIYRKMADHQRKLEEELHSGLWERVWSLPSTWGKERRGKLLGILRTPSTDPDILLCGVNDGG